LVVFRTVDVLYPTSRLTSATFDFDATVTTFAASVCCRRKPPCPRKVVPEPGVSAAVSL
jgi:hypothetical protein